MKRLLRGFLMGLSVGLVVALYYRSKLREKEDFERLRDEGYRKINDEFDAEFRAMPTEFKIDSAMRMAVAGYITDDDGMIIGHQDDDDIDNDEDKNKRK